MINLECEMSPDPGSITMEQLEARLGASRLNSVLGRAARNAVKDHLRARNLSTQNAFGATKSNYYGQAARSTSFSADEDGAVVPIHQVGMRLHYYGGPVVPGASTSSVGAKPTRYLTIPACAEAYGKRASEFGVALEVLWGRKGPFALALKERENPERRGASKAENIALLKKATTLSFLDKRTASLERVMFWLVKEATIRPDPTVIPDEDEFSDAIRESMENYLTSLEERDYINSLDQQADDNE